MVISALYSSFCLLTRVEVKTYKYFVCGAVIFNPREIYEEDLLFTSTNYDIFCSLASKIPNVFNEIARLREITYREVGEGTLAVLAWSSSAASSVLGTLDSASTMDNYGRDGG